MIISIPRIGIGPDEIRQLPIQYSAVLGVFEFVRQDSDEDGLGNVVVCPAVQDTNVLSREYLSLDLVHIDKIPQFVLKQGLIHLTTILQHVELPIRLVFGLVVVQSISSRIYAMWQQTA